MHRSMKRIISAALAVCLLLSVSAAAFASSEDVSDDPLNILNHADEWELVEDDEIGDYYALEGIVYVADPVDVTYETMNIYVPAAIFEGGEVNGYTAETAPMIMVINVGGYAGSTAGTIGGSGPMGGGGAPGGMARSAEASSSDEASDEASDEDARPATPGLAEASSTDVSSASLQMGYVVVTAGCRGRDTTNEDGTYNGKGASGLVDMKAAVRYLHYNDENLCGDADKIIATGHSAGGSLTLLLGTTGNSPDYEPYLEEIGAADARDDIYAAAPSCPILDVEHGDLAYEWMYGSLLDDPDEVMSIISDGLAALYPDYINSLDLTDGDTALTLEEDGTGTFRDYITDILSQSATVYLLDLDEDAREAYLADKTDWLVWDDDAQAATVDMDGYAAYEGRLQYIVYDGLELDQTMNWTFGDTDGEYVHFTTYVYDILTEAGYPEEAEAYSTAEVSELVEEQVSLINPMTYVLDDSADMAPYIRIMAGTLDTFQSVASPIAIGTAISSHTDSDVTFNIVWEEGHNSDAGTAAFFEWTESVCR